MKLKGRVAAQVLADREFLRITLERIKEGIEAIDQDLSDPHRDGSGTDSRVPDADAYNELYATVAQLVTDALDALAHINRT